MFPDFAVEFLLAELAGEDLSCPGLEETLKPYVDKSCFFLFSLLAKLEVVGGCPGFAPSTFASFSLASTSSSSSLLAVLSAVSASFMFASSDESFSFSTSIVICSSSLLTFSFAPFSPSSSSRLLLFFAIGVTTGATSDTSGC